MIGTIPTRHFKVSNGVLCLSTCFYVFEFYHYEDTPIFKSRNTVIPITLTLTGDECVYYFDILSYTTMYHTTTTTLDDFITAYRNTLKYCGLLDIHEYTTWVYRQK